MLGTDLLTLLGALATIAGPTPRPARPTRKPPIVACTLDSAEKSERSALLEREIVPNIAEVRASRRLRALV